MYSIKIIADPSAEDFLPCKLLSRHWEIREPGNNTPKIVNGPGVIG